MILRLLTSTRAYDFRRYVAVTDVDRDPALVRETIEVWVREVESRNAALAALDRVAARLAAVEAERDGWKSVARTWKLDVVRAEARIRELEAALAIFREFYKAWWVVERGVSDFELHSDAVARLSEAHAAALDQTTEADDE